MQLTEKQIFLHTIDKERPGCNIKRKQTKQRMQKMFLIFVRFVRFYAKYVTTSF